VDLISTENEEKSCVFEWWNRTMKDRMCKCFTANITRRYVDVLNDMVYQYNNTKHSAVKMTPVNASDPENLY
jgi:L-rhamnose mutarotase